MLFVKCKKLMLVSHLLVMIFDCSILHLYWVLLLMNVKLVSISQLLVQIFDRLTKNS